MPNWTENNIRFECDNKGRIKQAIQALLNENGEVDFRKVVPRPATLMIEHGGYTKAGIEYWELRKKKYSDTRAQKKAFASFYSNIYLTRKAKRLGQIAMYNKQKYGSITWYYWSYANWGTKWNADECVVGEEGVNFTTANGDSRPVMLALSKMFPDVHIYLQYADDDIGYHLGDFEYFEGTEYSLNDYEGGSEESIRFACELWGYDYDEYIKDIEEQI